MTTIEIIHPAVVENSATIICEEVTIKTNTN
jgi:hypothetical protein